MTLNLKLILKQKETQIIDFFIDNQLTLKN